MDGIVNTGTVTDAIDGIVNTGTITDAIDEVVNTGTVTDAMDGIVNTGTVADTIDGILSSEDNSGYNDEDGEYEALREILELQEKESRERQKEEEYALQVIIG